MLWFKALGLLGGADAGNYSYYTSTTTTNGASSTVSQAKLLLRLLRSLDSRFVWAISSFFAYTIAAYHLGIFLFHLPHTITTTTTTLHTGQHFYPGCFRCIK